MLTGGGIGTKVLAAIAAAPARDAVDWRHVDFWWGDERFEAAGDPERNETGARAALLDALGVDPARVHAVPGPDGPDGDDPDAAAARYAAELAAAAGDGRRRPRLRRADARHRPGGPRRVDLPRLPGRARDRVSRRRPELPQAAAHPDLPHVQRHPGRP